MASGKFETWGPYLSYGSCGDNEIRIAWREEKFTFKPWIKYGNTSQCDKKTEMDLPEASKEHVFILSDLKPNTAYFYQISRDSQKTYSFTMGPKIGSKEPFSFTVMGDIHAYPANQITRGFETMLEVAPNHHFGVAVGDSINDGNNPEHWNAFFEDAKTYLEQKPLMNSTGNHDTDNEDKYARFLNAWQHPFVNPKKGGYYLMEYGNAVFFFVDSNNAGGWEPTPSDEQYEWLESNLQRYAKKDRWIFLFMHHQIYSTGDFSCANIMHQLYRPLCQEYHVDAVFYGHDHHYECYWVDRESAYGGTLFFVSGAAGGQHHVDHGIMGDRDGKTKYIWPGRFLNVRKHGVPPASPKSPAGTLGFRNDDVLREGQLLGVLEPHFLHIEIAGDSMELKAIGWQKQIFHHLSLKRAGCGRKFTSESEKKILDY